MGFLFEKHKSSSFSVLFLQYNDDNPVACRKEKLLTDFANLFLLKDVSVLRSWVLKMKKPKRIKQI